MREIKFRGKRVDNDKWVYGYYAKAQNIPVILRDIGGFYINIQPETVGQFTGLKDKNGVEIYEGDIVRSKYFSDSVVIFKDGKFMAQDTLLDQEYDGIYPNHIWQVIDNIQEEE